jgi:thiosulfate/3-mercaptopyruvate sulfurtransferase
MRLVKCALITVLAAVLAGLAPMGRMGASPKDGEPPPDYPWTRAEVLQPAELAKIVVDAKAEKPVLLHVGFRVLYLQAHIPGSEFVGPTAREEGIERLKERARQIPQRQEIVLYCGCCPWDHCPNLRPAYETLRALGFPRIKVLYIPRDFGHDWVDKGFPVARD